MTRMNKSQNSIVENGEIAAVMIDDEATLKRVRPFDDHISLEPENPLYRPLVYWAEEMNAIRIIGKAVANKFPPSRKTSASVADRLYCATALSNIGISFLPHRPDYPIFAFMISGTRTHPC